MPIFEYKCEDCGQEFSKLVFKSAKKVECPKCGFANVTKKFSTISSISSGSNTSAPSCGGSSGFS